jgi:secondary thiamine-phosphate synthase enzyme
MNIFQKEFNLSQKRRGFHLVTSEILRNIPELKNFSIGIAHIFIKHTSASLTINENADPSVREDMEKHFNVLVPEDADYYEHTLEGPDDMTSHIKNVLLGSSVTIPIKDGSLNLGTWQGIYLCEHRNDGGRRKIVVTLAGKNY